MSYGRATYGLLAYSLEPESGIPRVSLTTAATYDNFTASGTIGHGVSLTVAKTYADFIASAILGHGVSLSTTQTIGVFVASATLGHGVSLSTSKTWDNFIAFANIGEGNALTTSATIVAYSSSAALAYGNALSTTATIDPFVVSTALAHGVSLSAALTWAEFVASARINVPTEGTGALWLPPKRRLNAEERKAIRDVERAWDQAQAKKIADDVAMDRAVTKRLDEIMDRHLGIVRLDEAPPPITAETVINALPAEAARRVDMGQLETELSDIRGRLQAHAAAMAEIEQRRIDQGEIEMMILAQL